MPSYDKDSAEYKFEKKTGLKLGKLLKGGNGKIYSLKDYPKRVVKIDGTLDADDRQYVMRIIKYLKKSKNTVVVKIHKAGIIRGGYHYYVMDKLKPLKDKWNTGDRLSQYIHGEEVPRFESPKVKAFVKGVIALSGRYYYADLHGGNIMLSEGTSLKLVDLESFTY
jgi:hypothetical protein